MSYAKILASDFCPTNWDTPPIAATLFDASRGFPEHLLLGHVLPIIIRRAQQMTRLTLAGEKIKLQQFVDRELRQSLYPDSIPLLLKRCLHAHWPCIEDENLVIENLKSFVACLCTAWATSILKTWAHAWTTSSRMHERAVHPCLFGCAGQQDDLHHYLRCSRLWRLVWFATRGQRNREKPSWLDCPENIGLVSMCC